LKKVGKTQKDFIADFVEAYTTEDWELAERLAHTLKGVAGNIGAETLRDSCANLEAQAKDGHVSKTDVEEAAQALDTILQSLTLLPENEPKTAVSKSIAYEALQPVLENLARQLEDFDTAAAETIENNRQLFYQAPIVSQSETLEKALERYDFTTALNVTNEIQDFIKNEVKEDPTEVDIPQLSDTLKQLTKFLSEYNTESIDILEREEGVFATPDLKLDYDIITAALDVYDFAKAVTIVAQTAKKYNIDLG